MPDIVPRRLVVAHIHLQHQGEITILEIQFRRHQAFHRRGCRQGHACSGDPDIGAPAELKFFPASMIDNARQYRSVPTTNTTVDPAIGLAALINASVQVLLDGNGRTAMQKFRAIVIILPDDAAI